MDGKGWIAEAMLCRNKRTVLCCTITTLSIDRTYKEKKKMEKSTDNEANNSSIGN